MGDLSCGMKCLKMVLFAFNFIFWICGIAVLGVGIWSRIDAKDWDSILGESGTVATAANIMIVAGVFVMLIGFLGCCGAWKENKVLLILYAILLILIFILEIAAGIYAYTKKEDVINAFEKNLKKAVTTDFGGTTASEKSLTESVKWFQENLKCCGSKGPGDWKNSTWQNKEKDTTKVPGSCCSGNKGESCPFADAYNKGCVEAGNVFIEDHMYQVGGVAVGIAFVQIFGIVSSILLCRALSSHDKL